MIGVSKRCCPSCAHLLYLLRNESSSPPEPFAFRAVHQKVSGCTLPMWLSSRIVMRMNKKFGGQLRAELINLMDVSEGYRKRCSSTGSGGPASYDSYKGQHMPTRSAPLSTVVNSHWIKTEPSSSAPPPS